MEHGWDSDYWPHGLWASNGSGFAAEQCPCCDDSSRMGCCRLAPASRNLIGRLADLKPHAEVTVRARKANGSEIVFSMLARIDSAVELRYWQSGGILQTVLREMARN